MERFGLRNDQWDRIKDILPGREGYVGGAAEDNRLFVEAVLYRFRTGCPWRDLPGAFRLLEIGPSAFQPMGEERGFQAYVQAVGQRSRQRGNSQGGVSLKYHRLVDFAFDEGILADLGLRL